jgi:hypothetical protein
MRTIKSLLGVALVSFLPVRPLAAFIQSWQLIQQQPVTHFHRRPLGRGQNKPYADNTNLAGYCPLK